MKVEITPDAKNTNCRRIHLNGSQLCKVYGWSSNEAQEKAEMIACALEASDEPTPEMISAGVAFAKGATISGQGGWRGWAATLYRRMRAARHSG